MLTKTENAMEKTICETNASNAENAKNGQSGTNLQEMTTSTPSSTSKMCDQLLGKESCSEAEIDQFEWIDIANTPFRIVGKPGAYTLVLANMAVSGQSFGDRTEAEKYVASKPWDLILIATKIYSELIEARKNELKNQ